MYCYTRGKVVYIVHGNLNIHKLLKNLPLLETSIPDTGGELKYRASRISKFVLVLIVNNISKFN